MRFPSPVIVLVPALFALSANAASAKILLITHGDTIAELGDIAKTTAADDLKMPPGNLKVGYKYSYGGLFWLDVWTWSGEYCLYQTSDDKSYYPISPELAAQFLGTTPEKLSKPFWYRYPAIPFFLIVAALPMLAIGIAHERYQNGRAAALLANPDYLTAQATALTADGVTTEQQRFDKAVKILMDGGQDEATARKNLLFLVNRRKAENKAAT